MPYALTNTNVPPLSSEYKQIHAAVPHPSTVQTPTPPTRSPCQPTPLPIEASSNDQPANEQPPRPKCLRSSQHEFLENPSQTIEFSALSNSTLTGLWYISGCYESGDPQLIKYFRAGVIPPSTDTATQVYGGPLAKNKARDAFLTANGGTAANNAAADVLSEALVRNANLEAYDTWFDGARTVAELTNDCGGVRITGHPAVQRDDRVTQSLPWYEETAVTNFNRAHIWLCDAEGVREALPHIDCGVMRCNAPRIGR